MTASPSPRIAVLGAVNMDLVVSLARLPESGETLLGATFVTTPGGKGANQAVAAARMGAHAVFAGRVGSDPYGPELRTALRTEGIDTALLFTDRGAASGVALITVATGGANTIIAVPGANERCDASDVERLRPALAESDMLLLQLELPTETSLAAARVAREMGVPVLIDPAPVRPLPPEAYTLADVMTPNETEASTLLGIEVHDSDSGVAAAAALVERGVPTAIVTLGEQGAAYATLGGDCVYLPARAIDAVDSVASGDAFAGALAVALAEGRPLDEAMRWGMAAGALCATVPGAQAAMPRRDAVLQLVEG